MQSVGFLEFRFKLSGFRKIDLHIQESDSFFGIGECVFDGGADCIHECHQGGYPVCKQLNGIIAFVYSFLFPLEGFEKS